MKIESNKRFDKQLRKCKKRGFDTSELYIIIEKIKSNSVEAKHRVHKWKGTDNIWELHIKPDWLLLYRKESDTLYLPDTGTHSDLIK